ncbi:50 kDa hatching enzyme-like [Neodiprion virginianus]|uniref:50 kDa hatching enzyme-like n=1 Tax=Neodiprion virginianus TaxID=2961670 RepID=UPI001EE7539B|nr:50 kDa hatching enzyme-like [Neodiprion virginianus]
MPNGRSIVCWADINISFVELDGSGVDLGQSNSPEGICWDQFDAAETWTIDSHRGVSLLQVADHEFGHALGIHHSSVESAAMWPYITGYDPNFKLDIDDVRAIQSSLVSCRSSPIISGPLGLCRQLCLIT